MMADSLTPVQERTVLLAVLEAKVLDNPFLSLTDFLWKLEELHPSQVIGTGGILFEAYLLRVLPPKGFTRVTAALAGGL